MEKAKKRLSIIITSAVLVLALVATSIAALITNGFKKNNIPVMDNVIVTPENNISPFKLTRAAISPMDFNDYGISPLAESAFTITATVKDENNATSDAYNFVNWNMAWKTTNSANVTEYVTMTENGMSATFSCLKVFTTQIVVTCTSTLDESLSARATLDYAPRISGIKANSVSITGTGSTVSKDLLGVSATQADMLSAYIPLYDSTTFGSGSLTNSISSYTVKVTASDAFYNALLTNMGNTVTGVNPTKTFTLTGTTAASKVNQLELFAKFLGVDINEGQQAVYASRFLMQQTISSTSNQLTVEVTVNPRYDEAKTYTYTYNLSVSAAALKNVELSSSSYIF